MFFLKKTKYNNYMIKKTILTISPKPKRCLLGFGSRQYDGEVRLCLYSRFG